VSATKLVIGDLVIECHYHRISRQGKMGIVIGHETVPPGRILYRVLLGNGRTNTYVSDELQRVSGGKVR
jgi:hypothetical protein